MGLMGIATAVQLKTDSSGSCGVSTYDMHIEGKTIQTVKLNVKSA